MIEATNQENLLIHEMIPIANQVLKTMIKQKVMQNADREALYLTFRKETEAAPADSKSESEHHSQVLNSKVIAVFSKKKNL